MPIINLEYDNEEVTDVEAALLSKAIKEIVSDSTEIKEVFVYTNSAQIKVGVDPIEIFVQMSKNISDDRKDLLETVSSKLSEWKKVSNFSHPINLTIIPMEWQIKIGI